VTPRPRVSDQRTTLGTEATGTAESLGTRSAFAGLGRMAALPAIGGVGSCNAGAPHAKSAATQVESVTTATTIGRIRIAPSYLAGREAQSGL